MDDATRPRRSSRRRTKGFLTLSNVAIEDLNQTSGIKSGTGRYIFLMCVWVVDHTDGHLLTSARWMATKINLNRRTVSRWLSELAERGMIIWTPGSNQEADGQLTIPGYEWWIGVEDAKRPIGGAVGGAVAGAVGGAVLSERAADDVQERAPRSREVQKYRKEALAQSEIARLSDRDRDHESHPYGALWSVMPREWRCLEVLADEDREVHDVEVQHLVAERRGWTHRPLRLETVREALEDLERNGLAVQVRNGYYRAVRQGKLWLRTAEAEGIWPRDDLDPEMFDFDGTWIGIEGR